MKSLMEMHRVCKAYVDGELCTPVLWNIDLVIPKGEFVAIMGPSGSGKSTLMHILGFLDVQSSGTYRFLGQSTEKMGENDLARIRATKAGFVFQAFNLLPRATVLENVMLPLLYHPVIPERERQKRAQDAVASVGLSDRAEYGSSKLSGGQKQRVAIARALVTEPEVIFADEPTGNLDSVSGKQVMDIFQNLHAAGHTIVLVTHDRDTAKHAERIINIRDGRIESDTHISIHGRTHRRKVHQEA